MISEAGHIEYLAPLMLCRGVYWRNVQRNDSLALDLRSRIESPRIDGEFHSALALLTRNEAAIRIVNDLGAIS